MVSYIKHLSKLKLHLLPHRFAIVRTTPAKIVELAKEYKITGVPFDAIHIDQLYNEFKHIPTEMIKLKPPPTVKGDLRSSILSQPCTFSDQEIKDGS